ncbi:hypothetical protein [Bradyrhizobium sp. 2TAF24]|uniref:hypothetical protein n=1 Tax=Bradyrhizobium sp. 2TAF24 TaxID=3233011 RepID=UPI003F8F8EEF
MVKTTPTSRLARAFALVTTTMLIAGAAQAAGTPEQRRACRADAFRLCKDAIPDVPRITACMDKNKAKLSPACRAQFK